MPHESLCFDMFHFTRLHQIMLSFCSILFHNWYMWSLHILNTTYDSIANSYVTTYEHSNAGVSYIVLGVVGLLAIVGITILVVYGKT